MPGLCPCMAPELALASWPLLWAGGACGGAKEAVLGRTLELAAPP